MSVKLQGAEGYYCREVSLSGSKFKIRELDDETLSQVFTGLMELRNTAELSPNMPVEQVMDEATIADITPEKQVAVLRQVRAVLDLAVRGGVTDWDLVNVTCNSENVVMLPNRIKISLMRAIMADSTLSEAEEGFLPK